MDTIKIGDTIKHTDGSVGRVVKIYSDLESVYVDWKFAGKYRTSNANLLTVVDNAKYRWHK